MKTVVGVLCFGLAAILAAAARAAGTNVSTEASQPYPVTAIVSSNTVTFPVLLSKNSQPLMTNAVFHRTFGTKVIFAEDTSIKSFEFDQLHPSVLAQLDLDPVQLRADQETLDQRYQQWATQFRAQVQQLLSAKSSASTNGASGATDTTASADNSTLTNSTPHHHFYHYHLHRVATAAKTSPKETPSPGK